MLHTTDLSFVTIKQASKLTFGLLESFDTKYLRTEKEKIFETYFLSSKQNDLSIKI